MARLRPQAGAVAWARAHLRGIRFEHSPEAPRLPYGDETFDFVYAISIWSHFSERRRSTGSTRCAACCARAGACCSPPTESTRWPHPPASASARRSSWRRSARRSRERGFWYTPEYEGIGDHGIANPDWGIAFLTAEWLLARATPRWRVALFHPGRVEANHDLYVLERR